MMLVSWNAMPHFSASSNALRIFEAENVNDGQAHHAGYVIAVIVQLGERPDAARLQIGAHAVDHVEEIFVRDAEALDGIDERRPQRMIGRLARQRGFKIATPPRDRSGAIGDTLVVGEIVAVAHERIDRAHGAPLRQLQQQK